MSESTQNNNLDSLKAKQTQLRLERSSLRIQLSNLESLPRDVSELAAGGLDKQNEKLAQQLSSLEEKTILFRSAGWTCFEIDLDVGRRARGDRKAQEGDRRGQDRDLGLGIRLDTFCRGRFFEPYYLVFAREDQLLDTPQLSSTTVGGTHSPAAREGLRLVRHTIPHFVPLESLVEKYLPLLLGGAESGGSSSSNTSDGGLALLQDFQQLPGLEPFLSDLHCHLQAYVSRREQVMSLQQLKLPTRSDDAGTSTVGKLDAFGTDAFDQIKILWRISGYEDPDGPQSDEDASAPEPDVDPQAAGVTSKRRAERQPNIDEPSRTLETMIQYMDLRSDRLVDDSLAVPSHSLADAGIDPDDPEARPTRDRTHDPFRGTRCPLGQVRIELVVSPPPSKRIRIGADGEERRMAEPQRTRRKDLEALVADERDGDGIELDEALQAVIRTLWSEEQGRDGRVG